MRPGGSEDSDQPMMTPALGKTREQHVRRRLRVAKWQTDMAYFQARLGLIGEPASLNQHAQRRTFTLLHQTVAEELAAAGKAESGHER